MEKDILSRVLLLYFVSFVSWTLSANADTFYSATTQESKLGFQVTNATRFEEKDSCEATAQLRRSAPDESWKPIGSECVTQDEMPLEIKRMFSKEVLTDPYLFFIDENNLPNVVCFQKVPPLMIDILAWKWADDLKQQGVTNIDVITTPNKLKIKELFNAAKDRMTSGTKKNEPNESAPRKTATPIDKTPTPVKIPETASGQSEIRSVKLVPNTKIFLKNGKIAQGIIMQRTENGIWLKMAEGIKVLIAEKDILRVEKEK